MGATCLARNSDRFPCDKADLSSRFRSGLGTGNITRMPAADGGKYGAVHWGNNGHRGQLKGVPFENSTHIEK